MTDNANRPLFIQGLQEALQKERTSQRVYRALAQREANETRRKVPPARDTLRERVWRWVLVQSGTDNALRHIESNEVDDTEMYKALADVAPTEADRAVVQAVLRDEEVHGGAMQRMGEPPPIDPQWRLDMILHRESWHRQGGGWIGQAIYGANDGLGSVFGIVSGVAGATAGGPTVPIAGLAGMIASALSMGSGAYLATKAEREVQEAEVRREGQELEWHPEEEQEELALFYQLKGVSEDEAQSLASHLIAQPAIALKTLASEELGLSEESFPNPWTAVLSASLSAAAGAFIPILPFFFSRGYPAIIASFVISTLAHFLIGAAKTIVTGLSPWRSGAEMTIVGLGEALITYSLGRIFGPLRLARQLIIAGRSSYESPRSNGVASGFAPLPTRAHLSVERSTRLSLAQSATTGKPINYSDRRGSFVI